MLVSLLLILGTTQSTPCFCFRFLKFWIDIHLLYSRVIGVVEDFAGKCKQMVHHRIHLGYQSGGDENIMLRFPQALINRFDYEYNSTCQPAAIISDSLIWAPFHLEKEPLQKWRWWTLVATFQIFTGKQMIIGWFLFRAWKMCLPHHRIAPSGQPQKMDFANIIQLACSGL